MLMGLYGAGAFGREMMPVLQEQSYGFTNLVCDNVFIDDTEGLTERNGYKVMKFEEFLQTGGRLFFNVAIADPQGRKKLVAKCMRSNLLPSSIVDKKATLYSYRHCGRGAIICANSIISVDTHIGDFFHCNVGCYVAHDVKIGDFVTLAPFVCINGWVEIGDETYIGAGAVIRDRVKIGKNVIIGMGAIVIEDVPDGATVVGNPAREIVYGKRIQHV